MALASNRDLICWPWPRSDGLSYGSITLINTYSNEEATSMIGRRVLVCSMYSVFVCVWERERSREGGRKEECLACFLFICRLLAQSLHVLARYCYFQKRLGYLVMFTFAYELYFTCFRTILCNKNDCDIVIYTITTIRCPWCSGDVNKETIKQNIYSFLVCKQEV